VEDCVDAHVRAHAELAQASPRCAGRAYFLGQASPVRLWDFVARLLRGFDAPPVRRKLSLSAAKALGAAFEGIYRLRGGEAEPPLTRMAAIMLGTDHHFDHGAAARDFGHVPQTDVDDALQATFEGGEPPGSR